MVLAFSDGSLSRRKEDGDEKERKREAESSIAMVTRDRRGTTR